MTAAPRTVADKLGVRPGSRAFLVDVPDAVRAALALPDLDLADDLDGEFAYLHLFVRRVADLDARLAELRAHLAPRGALWVSWPKGRRLGSDLTLTDVARIAFRHRLIESKAVAVDSVWSALKLTHPVEGRTYRDRTAPP